jgi:hypothetical protein
VVTFRKAASFAAGDGGLRVTASTGKYVKIKMSNDDANESNEIEFITLNAANDPVPAKGIRLTEAFQRVLKGLLANPALIEPVEHLQPSWVAELKKLDPPWASEAAANALFRIHLVMGKYLSGEDLYANVRDPETGEILQLHPHGWEIHSAHLPFNEGIVSDWVVDPHDKNFPGPTGTFIRGAYRPVFFWRDEFERWFEKAFGQATKRRGRKPGSGSFEHTDEPFLMKMHELMKNGSAKSADDAARQVATSAPGASFDSTRTRLAKRYRKRFPPEHN